MKVYVLTMTYQMGQGGLASSTVLGVYQTKERAEEAHHKAVVDEMAEFVENYDEVATQETTVGTIITNPSDDWYWTIVRLEECEIE